MTDILNRNWQAIHVKTPAASSLPERTTLTRSYRGRAAVLRREETADLKANFPDVTPVRARQTGALPRTIDMIDAVSKVRARSWISGRWVP